MDLDGRTRQGFNGNTSPPVCKYFVMGKCSYGVNCKFFHPSPGATPGAGGVGSKRNSSSPVTGRLGPTSASGNGEQRWGKQRTTAGSSANGHKNTWTRPTPKVHRTIPCKFWLHGDCHRGSACTFLHAHTTAPDVEMVNELKGHDKAVRCIMLPSGSTQLLTGSQDKTIRAWDCTTGQCVSVEQVEDDVGALLNEAGWLFAGQPNVVKAFQAGQAAISLPGPRGAVNALASFKGYLFAGCSDGQILVWKMPESPGGGFEAAGALAGHTAGIVTLQVAGDRLYSGSMDHTIRVWDLPSGGQCVQTLAGHTDVVMGLLCWGVHLLSCSLDGTVKVWEANAAGQFELKYTHEGSGEDGKTEAALAMCGSLDASSRPVLLVAYNDNTVRLFDLPQFSHRGTLFSNNEVRTIHVAPPGSSNIFFTGDNGGRVKVWRWLQAPPMAANGGSPGS
eukprot:TRINITY_DN17101_c0_g1_i1.p1 TRINITY_DN17101_c0_g1~~TRINITY_DN17101_c0_g1_i1.p1  ORF type:complete len:447 (-),score=48.39 TRINITY_DN17101_c0_g1_i1:1268-2608(-)